MDVSEALLDSWDRQCRIVDALAARIDDSNKNAKPSDDGMPLYEQLAHIHEVRVFWLSNFDPDRAKEMEPSYRKPWTDPLDDLDTLRKLLKQSAKAIRDAVEDAMKKGMVQVMAYDNPVVFLQHMVWHEGWHVGLIFLGLRLAGQEPSETWEEEHVWGEWRTE